MRRDAVAIGHKKLSYLIADPSGPAVRQRPASTVVFLHAFPLHSAMWESSLASVPEGWRAVAPDYRGEPGIRMGDLAGDVVDLLDHLGVTQAAVIGCSMGGYVLFELLKSAPRYVSAVGLVSTRPGADNEEGRKNRQKMIELVDREGVEAVADQMVPKLLGATTQRDRPDLPKKVRNLIVANPPERVKGRGESDDGARRLDAAAREDRRAGACLPRRRRYADSARRSGRYASRDQDSQFELMPFSGHLPNLEQSAPFDGLLWSFLKKL